MPLELIYRRSMDSPPERSTAVTAAAVVAILAGLFLLLCFSVALLALLLVKLPSTAPELPPSVENPRHWGSGLFDLAVPLRYGNRHWTHLSSQLGAHLRPDWG